MNINMQPNSEASTIPSGTGRDLSGMVFGELTVLERLPAQGKNKGIRWRCRCSCGREYETLGSLLRTGRRVHCGGDSHPKNYASADIAGQKFGRLTALEPTSYRDARGFVIWKCRCDCGSEPLISYNELKYTNLQSCGCSRKEHSEKLRNYLTHVDGTSVDILKSKKTPKDNTTGCRGVYFIRGKYVAKISFQKKTYYLGAYDMIDEAIKIRKEAEALLFDGTADYYQKWKARADEDPDWANQNPIHIEVEHDKSKGLQIRYLPEMK